MLSPAAHTSFDYRHRFSFPTLVRSATSVRVPHSSSSVSSFGKAHRRLSATVTGKLLTRSRTALELVPICAKRCRVKEVCSSHGEHNKRMQNDRTKSIALCLPSQLVGGI